MNTRKRNRVLIAKVGLDGHDRGAKVVARGLRDAGFEVIYTGIRQRPADVVRACVEEDVQALGLSSLSGGHMANFMDVIAELKSAGIFGELLLFAGGVIPEEDRQTLIAAGFLDVYPPGTSLKTITEALQSRIK